MANIIRAVWSPAELLKNSEVRAGPPTKRLAAGWLSDLVALRKAIVLCPQCERKYSPERFGYKHKIMGADVIFVGGKCDACGVFYSRAKLFLPEGSF